MGSFFLPVFSPFLEISLLLKKLAEIRQAAFNNIDGSIDSERSLVLKNLV